MVVFISVHSGMFSMGRAAKCTNTTKLFRKLEGEERYFPFLFVKFLKNFNITELLVLELPNLLPFRGISQHLVTIRLAKQKVERTTI